MGSSGEWACYHAPYEREIHLLSLLHLTIHHAVTNQRALTGCQTLTLRLSSLQNSEKDFPPASNIISTETSKPGRQDGGTKETLGFRASASKALAH